MHAMIYTGGTNQSGEKFTRVAVMMGSGKVHYGRKYEGYNATPQCGGNRASERYRVVNLDVECKNCLKLLAAEEAAEQAHAERVADSMAPSTGEGDYLPPAEATQPIHQPIADALDEQSAAVLGGAPRPTRFAPEIPDHSACYGNGCDDCGGTGMQPLSEREQVTGRMNCPPVPLTVTPRPAAAVQCGAACEGGKHAFGCPTRSQVVQPQQCTTCGGPANAYTGFHVNYRGDRFCGRCANGDNTDHAAALAQVRGCVSVTVTEVRSPSAPAAADRANPTALADAVLAVVDQGLADFHRAGTTLDAEQVAARTLEAVRKLVAPGPDTKVSVELFNEHVGEARCGDAVVTLANANGVWRAVGSGVAGCDLLDVMRAWAVSLGHMGPVTVTVKPPL